MLIIRNAQINVFRKDFNTNFAREISPTVRDEFGHETAGFSDEELVEYLAETVARAQGYGISLDNDLLTFIRLSLTIAQDFDNHGVFHSILTDQSIPEDQKIDEIFRRAGDEDWIAAMSEQ